MNKYVEHIINDLVRDTRIDYDIVKEIQFPFLHYPLPSPSPHLVPLRPFLSLHFSKYCKEKYGLTKDEIEYIWEKYKSIIKDKIENNE